MNHEPLVAEKPDAIDINFRHFVAILSKVQKPTPLFMRYVGFYALDDGGQLVGGIQGNFEWDWLHITHLWVKDRGRGLGRQLVELAESFAKQHGKRGLFLDTLEFQARPFYEKLGFVVIGKIENTAGLNARYFMSKRLC